MITDELAHIIAARKSVRTFAATGLDAADRDYVRSLACAEKSYRLFVIDGDLGRVGTYGVIKGASTWMAIICTSHAAGSEFEAGIAGQKCVLSLTARGMATCWLGATYNKSTVSKLCQCREDEYPAAIIAIGYASGHRRMVERISSALAHSRSRQPFDRLFTIKEDSDRVREALEMVRQAPSSTNSQPWRAIADSDGVHFYCHSHNRFSKLDMGIGFAHFMLATGCALPKPIDGKDKLLSDSTYIGSVVI